MQINKSITSPTYELLKREPTERIIGFDLARAYAIFGMYIVNFNFCFGSIMQPTELLGRFMNLFTGNSTAIFIICAGMGVSMLATRSNYTNEEKANTKSIILKRSWFLLVIGLLLYNWWPGDILHFYGGYMHLAAFIMYVPKRYYIIGAITAIVIFHLLLLAIPINTGWDFSTYRYQDFWTPIGFLRNTLYNGWNSIFPWVSFFLIGMYIGKLNWKNVAVVKNVFKVGLIMFAFFQTLRLFVKQGYFSPSLANYITAEYFPPYLPFIMLTMGFAFMAIAVFMYIGGKYSESKIVLAFQKTGQMTLSLYVIHITIGMMILAVLTGKNYTGFLEDETPTPPLYILGYSILFYALSVLFSLTWRKKFKHGPLETLMRISSK